MTCGSDLLPLGNIWSSENPAIGYWIINTENREKITVCLRDVVMRNAQVTLTRSHLRDPSVPLSGRSHKPGGGAETGRGFFNTDVRLSYSSSVFQTCKGKAQIENDLKIMFFPLYPPSTTPRPPPSISETVKEERKTCSVYGALFTWC